MRQTASQTFRCLALGLALLAAGCMTRVDTPPKSVLFFNAQSAELDTPAQGIIAEFTKDAKTAPNRKVLVEGYADKVGSPEANRILSTLRAQVVSDALIANGIDRSRIVQKPRGATDSDPGIESRRVELELAP